MLAIEFARRQQNKTQIRLGAETRIAAHFISLIENGRGIPTEEQADRLAAALGVPADSLLRPVPDLVGESRG